jgi:hypothetical protein
MNQSRPWEPRRIGPVPVPLGAPPPRGENRRLWLATTDFERAAAAVVW